MLVLIGILLAIAIGCSLIFGTDKNPNPNIDVSEGDHNNDSPSDITVEIPGVGNEVNSNENEISGSENQDFDNIEEDNSSDDSRKDNEENKKNESPKVESSSTVPTQDKDLESDTDIKEDSVTSGIKDNVVQAGPTSGEDRNDAILDEKEEYIGENTNEFIVNIEISYIDYTDKSDVISEDLGDVGHGKNEVSFISPVTGGENPFAQGNETEVTDKDVSEYIGNGDRPGEGIHF